MGEAPDVLPRTASWYSDRATVLLVAIYLVIAATTWYLLRELAPVLRPLMLAAFLAYVILPVQAHLARRVPGKVAYLALGLATVGVCYLLALLTYQSATALDAELPRYTDRRPGARHG
jgi:predicted PurR-regulated permease PerM